MRRLRAIGIQNPPNWLNDPTWVYPGLVLLGIWGIGNFMLISLAALQGVPTELYDAAKIDGAGPVRTFWNVTFPMISPVDLLHLDSRRRWSVPVLYCAAGPEFRVRVRPVAQRCSINLHLYKTFFTYQNMSYGATLAWFLFLIILVVTASYSSGHRSIWVFYAGEGRK